MPSSPASVEKSSLFKNVTAAELTGRTNKNPEAVDREYERALIGLTPAPCIKGWSQEQILAHANTCGSGGHLFNVEVPPIVLDILTSPNIIFPLTSSIVRGLESLVADHNGVPPDKICADHTIPDRGHQWKYHPETAPILTGFDYLV